MTARRLMLNVQSNPIAGKVSKEAVGKFFRPQVHGLRLTSRGG